MITGLFDEATDKVDLVAYCEKAGLKFVGARNERRSWCPLCEAGAKSQTVFRVRVEQRDWRCFGCGQFGDVTDLHRRLKGFASAGEAARDLLGGKWEPPKTVAPAVKMAQGEDREARIREIAANLWNHGYKIAGKAAERYLVEARKIDPEVVAAAGEAIRYNPFAPHHWDKPARAWAKAPGVVVQACGPDGWVGSVHVTYLTRDGSAKAALDPARRMWGPQVDPDGRRTCAWLIGPDGPADLVVGEGVETTLSAVTWLKARGVWPVRAAAALSLLALQGTWAIDKDGCTDVWDPEPGAPAWTWPPPADGGRVFIAVDRDMSPQKMRGRNRKGRPIDFRLDAEARAAFCARLAGKAWRAAGWPSVRALFPAPNGDWNDLVKRQAV